MTFNQRLLSAHKLGRRLPDRWLWRGVSFDLGAGESVGLVAPSGAGKTLLMRNLVLLDPLQEGDITFLDKPPSAWTLPVYRTRVMYLPQRATAFKGTVQDNLKQAFDLSVHRQRQFDWGKIEVWLDKLGRGPEFLMLKGSQLSGGESQILALLRAMQLDPQVLLLDEPTASLDAHATAQVEALLNNWLQQPDHACLLTSHDSEQVHRVTHRQINLGYFN